jgi:PTH1 family peptidyl-tRNA hydrolase
VRLIVGLGNPGSEYAGTRHNIGFDVVDAAAARFGCAFHKGPGEYLIAEGAERGEGFLLLKPMTYMNNSGVAVRDALDRSGLAPEDLVVISDDFHLPLGRLRLRLEGSAGGHNGLGSIIEELGSGGFPRLRCGIGGTSMPENKRDRKEYVLARFEAGERSDVGLMIGQAHSFLTLILSEGPEKAQHRFHNTL